MKIFSFDVESIGLHGEGFAVGYVLLDGDKELCAGYFAVPPQIARGTDASRQWVAEHVPEIVPSHDCLIAMRSAFWERLQQAKADGALILSDCAWPVESNFLSACVADDVTRSWTGPYPLVDVSAAVVATGGDPTATRERLDTELPPHHPVADARQSARVWREHCVFGASRRSNS